MDPSIQGGGILAALLALPALATAQVTLVEPGHTLVLHMDSMAPLHPSQAIVEATQPVGDIESICVDRSTGDVFFQLIFPPGSPTSTTTHVFRLSPAAGGLVAPVALNTGFGINERGTDLQIDPATGLLVTQDQNWVPTQRIAWVNPMTGLTGTWSPVMTPPIFLGGTFGMDFSKGAAGTVVPAGDIVFTSDVGAGGIHSCTFMGPTSVTHVPVASMPGGGDDIVVQPDGDWIWVGDFLVPITQFSPKPPFTATPSALNLQGMFTAAGLPFVAGSRAAVCDITGVIYVTFSGMPGGSGLFRVDEPLTTATLVLTVGGPNQQQGIGDLELGPSTTGVGNSVYFTVHDYASGAEQVWEVTASACCPVPASSAIVPDPGALNAPTSISPFPAGITPQIGKPFAVFLDDPGNMCTIPPGSMSFLLLNFWPGTLVFPSLGCAPAAPGDVMLALPPVIAGGPVPWAGPGLGAVHPLPIPMMASLCGLPVYLQGLWLVGGAPSAPVVLSWRLDLILGS